MRDFFCRLFALNRGEEKKVFLFSLTGFLWAMASTCGLKYSDTLFIYHIGADSLPTIYKSISCGMILLSVILLYAYHHTTGKKIFRGLVLAGAVFYSLAYICYSNQIGTESKWLWYVLRVFGALFFYPLITGFWTFIDQYFVTKDAKRLFGIFCSSIYVGSFSTGQIMQSGIMTVRHVFLFIVILMLISAFLTYLIARKFPVPEEEEVHPEDTSDDFITLKDKLQTVLTSKYTLLVFLGSFLGIFLWGIAEYNYMSVFEARFVTDSGIHGPRELTRFVGNCFSYISIVNVIFGVFIYGRLVNRFGVGSIILCTPMLYLLTFSGWLINDTLIFPVMGMFVVEGSAEILDNSNLALLVKAAPGRVKSILRVMVESVFEPLGMLASGVVLSTTTVDTKFLGLGIALLAVTAALTMKMHYFKNARGSISLKPSQFHASQKA